MNYSTQLSELLKLLPELNDANSDLGDHLINDLAIDSRQVSQGALFFALPGSVVDGRDFIVQAQSAGAAAVLYEADNFVLPNNLIVPALGIHDLSSKVGMLANVFFAEPSKDMQVFGVTGTNGKTTCCYLLAQALTIMGMQAAIIGTLGVGPLDDIRTGTHTTPDAVSVHRQLAQLRDQGITQVCMEVSSHALEQGRVNGVSFYCTVFTNLSQDHLDYHKTMRAYATAKLKLFTDFHSELVITNTDDQLGATIIDVANSNFIASYGQGSDVSLQRAELNAAGMRLHISANDIDFSIDSSLVGKVNVPNLLMLVTTLLSLGTPIKGIQATAAKLEPAPGRMELFSASGMPCVVVDFAHTPDALEKALLSIQEHCQGQLWCVFGCGGDRDKAKRPMMGRAAESLADKLIVTNDNPRTEDPDAIAADISGGMQSPYQVILDRATAIKTAIEQAAANDWVLVAGKGHETTQTIGDQVRLFSDREYVAQVLGEAA